MTTPVSGAVLAGGRSSRFGGNKALTTLLGRPLIAHALAALRPLFPDLVIVAADVAAYTHLGAPVRPDRRPGCGPLGGIYTALCETDHPFVFCLACDMPFVAPRVVSSLVAQAGGCDVVVPRSAAGYEPLHAVYGKGCIPAIEAMLGRGELRVDVLFSAVRARCVAAEELLPLDPAGRAFWNINTAADLEQARVWLEERRAPST